MNTLTRSLGILLVAFMVLALPTMEGKQNGIHNTAGSGCSCHYSGSGPTINHNFPSTYNAGQTYNIQISSTGGISGSNGGFNVVVDKGTLSTPGVGIMSVKIDSSGQSATHTTNSYRSWSFDWTAPSSGSGTTNVDIAVLTANGNGVQTGDGWTSTSITVPEAGPSNTAPTASNVYISDTVDPSTAISQAYYDVDLLSNYVFYDADGDADSGTQIRWMKGGTTISQYNDVNQLSQSATSIGDIWTVSITPSDGTDSGTTVTSSNSVEIIDYDADGDGYGDQSDAFPNDENEWADSDNDGVGDNADAFPDDANEWADSDNDGVGDNADAFPNDATETLDSDNDGVGDNADAFDDDNTQSTDNDGDGYGDNASGNNPDAFPNDANEWFDSDGDGVGDNADAFPNDENEWADSDNDGVGDNADAFPNNANEWLDSDNDGVGDNADVFPMDASETMDSDNDGEGDNADTDDDNDGLLDTEETTLGTDPFDEDTDGDEVNDKDDALPLDASETMDTDGDGIGDNTDTDDDADGLFDLDELSKGTDRLDPDSDDDGVLDGDDVFPMDASETMDSDNDGVGDNADAFPNDPLETVDTDADGVGDNADAFPENPKETLDSDGDGMGDNQQMAMEQEEEEKAAKTRLFIIIGAVLLLTAVGVLLFMRRNATDEFQPKETTPLPGIEAVQSTQQLYPTQTPEPVQPIVAQPTVENQWTDENGHTWRQMSDGSTLWWNGTDWQNV